jgi:uncharacterized membrane protein
MSDREDNSIMYVVAYLIPILTGIFVYIFYGNNKRLKFNAVQSIILGIAIIMLDVIFYLISLFILVPLLYLSYIIGIILWLYGLYIGYKASLGTDISIPYIGEYAEKLSGLNR